LRFAGFASFAFSLPTKVATPPPPKDHFKPLTDRLLWSSSQPQKIFERVD